MRRLARRLFTLFAAVSLLLCVAACVTWVRTTKYDYYNRIGFPSDNVSRAITMSGGTLYFRHLMASPPWWEPGYPWSYEGGTPPPRPIQA